MDNDPPVPTISEFVRSYPFRIGIYAIITLIVFEGVYFGIRSLGPEAMGHENGPIEMAQVAMAVIGSLGLFFAASIAPIGRAGLVACGAAVAYAAVRELDQTFEMLFFDDAYKWIVGLPMVVLVLGVAWVDRRRMLGDAMWLLRHPAATLFAIAGVYLCFVCQILDRPEMWIGVVKQSQIATTKALIEEYSELFAYLLIAISGIEAAIMGLSQRAMAKRQSRDAEPADSIRIAA